MADIAVLESVAPAFETAPTGLLAAARRVVNQIKEARFRRRRNRTLQSLSDAQLYDIGFDPAEVRPLRPEAEMDRYLAMLMR